MMPGQSDVRLEFKPEKSYKDLELGFIEGSNPRAYNRLLAMASTNAVRTMVKPMRAAAPKTTGRLARSITAKSGRYQRPSATVGPRPGKSRADTRGAWYRYFVTSGHKVRGAAQGARTGLSWGDVAKGAVAPAISGVKRVAGRPFVYETARNESNLQRAMDAYYATIERFLNDNIFRSRITKFKRKGK